MIYYVMTRALTGGEHNVLGGGGGAQTEKIRDLSVLFTKTVILRTYNNENL